MVSLGLFGFFQAAGPTLGFIVGGILLNIYVDYPKVSREKFVLQYNMHYSF